MQALNRIWNKLKNRRKMIHNYFKVFRTYRQKSQGHQAGQRSVYFNLDDRRMGNYFYVLLSFFEQAGYNIFLKHNFWFIGNCLGYDQYIFSLKRLKIIRKVSPSTSLTYVYDEEAQSRFPHALNFEKNVALSLNVFSSSVQDDQALIVPFGMHPNMYHLELHKNLSELRNQVRKMRIFFSGNLYREAYEHEVLRVFFNKLNRIQVIDTLKMALTDEEHLLVDKPDKLLQLAYPYQNKLVLNEWTWSPTQSSQLDNRIKTENWLHFLSHGDFFFGLPRYTYALEP
ncbi:MAG: hypothetical protein HC880_02125 [Bacteroidia bacterium]|nr:hypothetical protein [Bacteroidia bacterium]